MSNVADFPKRKKSDADNGRREIEIAAGREREVAEAVIAEVADRARDIYQRGEVLVHVVSEPRVDSGVGAACAPRIRALPRSLLRERIDNCTQLKSWSPKLAWHNAHPPDWLVRAIHERKQWPCIRPLTGVIQSPVIRPDGTLVDEPGYDAATGLLYEPNVAVPPVRPRPSKDEAIAARDRLLEIVQDFPFKSEIHRSAWFAYTLTCFARWAFRGPAPAAWIDGNVPGCGKGKLAQIPCVLADGELTPVSPQPVKPEEESKSITAAAIAGYRFNIIDNCTLPIGSSALEALLTTTRWRGRVLGVSLDFDGDVFGQWIYTGVNLSFRKKDTIRRGLWIRIESPMEAPEKRCDFRVQGELLDHVRIHRGELIHAALTCLRAHAVADRPAAGMKPWGSFEGWSDVVRACVTYLDLPDPADAGAELASMADVEGAALRRLLLAWEQEEPLDIHHGRLGMTADAAVKSTRMAEALDAFRGKETTLTARALGFVLRGLRERVVDVGEVGAPRRLKLSGSPNRKGVTVWSVVDVS